jgi:hypothetical protein
VLFSGIWAQRGARAGRWLGVSRGYDAFRELMARSARVIAAEQRRRRRSTRPLPPFSVANDADLAFERAQ